MSERSVSEMLEEIKGDLDDVERDMLLHHLEHAWIELTYVAWQTRRARDAEGSSPPRIMRVLVEQAEEFKKAYIALGGVWLADQAPR